MAIDIRALSPGDEPLFDRIAPGVFDKQVTTERLAAYLAEPNHHLVVALNDGELVGQCEAVIHRHPDKATHLYIEEVAVTPAWRRKGVGRAMIEAMIELGRGVGCEEIWVLSEPGDAAAAALYDALSLPGRPAVMHERKSL